MHRRPQVGQLELMGIEELTKEVDEWNGKCWIWRELGFEYDHELFSSIAAQAKVSTR